MWSFLAWLITFCCHLVSKMCPILLLSMDCSPPGSSVHAISDKPTEVDCYFLLQVSSWLKNQTRVSWVPGRFFTTEPWEKVVTFINTYLRFLHVFSWFDNSFFWALNYAIVWVYCSVYIHSPTEGYHSHFQVLTIMNKTGKNICVQAFVWT